MGGWVTSRDRQIKKLSRSPVGVAAGRWGHVGGAEAVHGEVDAPEAEDVAARADARLVPHPEANAARDVLLRDQEQVGATRPRGAWGHAGQAHDGWRL